MQVEEFESEREFNKRFPSKTYICSKCNHISANPYYCTLCKNQSNNFIYAKNTLTYSIKGIGKTEQIFKPIELSEKGIK